MTHEVDPGPAATVPGEDRAVLDRVVDGTTAVLLVGPAEDELHLPVGRLPDGAADGTWVILDLRTEPPCIVGIDHELTEARRTDLSSRLDRLRQERRGGRFER